MFAKKNLKTLKIRSFSSADGQGTSILQQQKKPHIWSILDPRLVGCL
jgi:hypothetical protein